MMYDCHSPPVLRTFRICRTVFSLNASSRIDGRETEIRSGESVSIASVISRSMHP